MNIKPVFCFILLFGFATNLSQSWAAKGDDKDSPVATITTLQELLNNTSEMTNLIESRSELIKSSMSEDEKKEQQAALEKLQLQLEELQSDYESVATGIAVRDYQKAKDQKFDLKSEVENLIQPMVYALKSLTADSRQIEHYKQQIEQLKIKQKDAKLALKNLSTLTAATPDGDLKTSLTTYLTSWQEEKARLDSERKVLDYQLKRKLESKESLISSTSSIFSGFFTNRGLNFMLGILAFLGVYLVLRFSYGFARKIWLARRKRQSTFDRLRDLIFHIMSLLVSITAMLFIFNLRNDWLLLGISILFLVAIGWALLKTLPTAVEKVMLMLNLGSVREGERVIYNGIPWQVDTLHFYSHLVNPDLTGGSVHVPARELVGLVSRPSDPHEEWFPSNEGEWVVLADETLGQVVHQSPEMVQVQMFGGMLVTYTTPAYLDQNPRNLSHGYRIQMVFGIDYKYQADCTTDIPSKMTAHFRAELLKIMDESELKRVVVDFFSPNASSLDFEYEAYVKGTSAHLYEEVERAMIYSFADVCNENGWEIPFQQITLHQAK